MPHRQATTCSPTSRRAAPSTSSRRSTPRARRTQDVVADAVARARRRLPARGRAARRPVALDAQRRDDAQPVEDRAPGRDRRGLRDDRLLALQRRVPRPRSTRSSRTRSTGRLEPDGVPAARGLRLRGQPVQLHVRSAGTCRPRRRSWATRSSGSRPRRRRSPPTTLMRLLQEAGLPDGVINLVYGSGATIGDAALASPELAGIHFTGSTGVFHGDVGDGRRRTSSSYRNYPRIVGETGGKDFILAHPSADAGGRRDRDRPRLVRVPGPEVLGRVAAVRARRTSGPRSRSGSSRTSRRSRWATSRDFENFMGAVIDASAFKTQADAIAEARAAGRGDRHRRRDATTPRATSSSRP